MNDQHYQWMSPLGVLSDPLSLDEVSAQIEQGRFFPAQGISRYGGEPVLASALPELRELWERVLPPMSPFDGVAGRAKPIVMARFFAELSLSRMTGYLSLRQNDAHLFFTIRIVDGQLLEVCAHDPSTYLGQLLVQQGLLTPDDLTQVLKITLERAQPIGKVCLDEGLISLKDLNKALAEQLFIRLRRIACFPKFDIRFRPDRRARMAPPVARVSGYAALEITLGYGLSDQEIKGYLSALRARPTLIDPNAKGISFLSAEDRNVLKRVHETRDLTPLTDRPHWTQRDGALKAIAWDMLHIFTVPRVYALLEELSDLQGPEGLTHLGIEEQSSPEERQQAGAHYISSLELSAPSESEEEERVKEAIRERLKVLISGPQRSPRERSALERIRQMGASVEDEELKRTLMFEEAMSDGEAALKRSKFAEAHQAFHEAVNYKPRDQVAHLQLIWSSFLSSDRSEGAYQSVKTQAERLIRLSPEATEPLFKLAQIHRVFGDMSAAEQCLREVLRLDPDHARAQAELKLLINLEFDEKKRSRGLFARGDQGGLNSRLSQLVIIALLGLSAALWGAGKLLPLNQSQWPEVRARALSLEGEAPGQQERQFYQSLRVKYDDELILSAAYRSGLSLHPKVKVGDGGQYQFNGFQKGRTTELSRAISHLFTRYQSAPEQVTRALRGTRLIPPNMRVLGILESYWLAGDPFWWGRRALLVLFALLGLRYVRPWEVAGEERDSLDGHSPWLFRRSLAPSWAALAIIYGVIVGYLSPSLSSPTPLPKLIGMISLHAVAEQLAFTALLCGALFKRTLRLPLLPLLTATLVFSLYRLSYVYLWYLPTETLLLSLLQTGFFVGGVTFFLAWKTRSMLPPILAHLSLTLTPALLSQS